MLKSDINFNKYCRESYMNIIKFSKLTIISFITLISFGGAVNALVLDKMVAVVNNEAVSQY